MGRRAWEKMSTGVGLGRGARRPGKGVEQRTGEAGGGARAAASWDAGAGGLGAEGGRRPWCSRAWTRD